MKHKENWASFQNRLFLIWIFPDLNISVEPLILNNLYNCDLETCIQALSSDFSIAQYKHKENDPWET